MGGSEQLVKERPVGPGALPTEGVHGNEDHTAQVSSWRDGFPAASVRLSEGIWPRQSRQSLPAQGVDVHEVDGVVVVEAVGALVRLSKVPNGDVSTVVMT